MEANLAGLAIPVVPRGPPWATRSDRPAVTARALPRIGRPEDEPEVRDLIVFGDPCGPAAPAARAWHWLGTGPVAERRAEVPGLLAGLGVRSGTCPADFAAKLTEAAGPPALWPPEQPPPAPPPAAGPAVRRWPKPWCWVPVSSSTGSSRLAAARRPFGRCNRDCAPRRPNGWRTVCWPAMPCRGPACAT